MGLLELAIIALVVSVIAGAMGYTDLAKGAGKAAKWLFIVFLVIAVLLFAMVALGIGAVANAA